MELNTAIINAAGGGQIEAGKLVGSAAAQVGGEKLRRLLAAARIQNASDAPAMPSPPTLLGSTAATTGLTVTLRPATAVDPASRGKPMFAMYGGTPVVSVTSWKSASVSVPSGGTISAGRSGQGYRIGFRTDATSLDLEFSGASGNQYRVLVDGVYTSKTAIVSGASGSFFLNAAFATRQARRIDVEIDATVTFAGLRCSPLDMVQRVSSAPRYRIGVFGNSISISTGATIFGNGELQHAARRLGNMDVDLVPFGIGGTDYANDANGASWDVVSHINDINLAPAEDGSGFDEVWFRCGINDASILAAGTITAAQLKAKALAAWRGLRTSGFAGPVFVFGPHVKTLSQSQAVETVLLDAFMEWADPFAKYVPTTQGTILPQSGSAYAAKFTGSVAGTSLTVAAVASGALAIGQYLHNPALPLGTYIVSGSGTSWVLSQGATISTTTFGAVSPGTGNFALYGGGTTGQDDTHPSNYGHDNLGSWLAAARAAYA